MYEDLWTQLLLWAGTYGGLIQVHEGAFRFYTTADGLPNDSVLALAQDSRGTLWAGTEGGGLCRFAGGRFEPVREISKLI